MIYCNKWAACEWDEGYESDKLMRNLCMTEYKSQLGLPLDHFCIALY